MPGLFSTPIPPRDDMVALDAREVVKELHGKPRLLARVTITGPYFAHRAAEPYVAVGDVRSLFVAISDDGLRADAYFDKPLPERGQVVFGWGRDVDLIVPGALDTRAIVRLDRRRLGELTLG